MWLTVSAGGIKDEEQFKDIITRKCELIAYTNLWFPTITANMQSEYLFPGYFFLRVREIADISKIVDFLHRVTIFRLRVLSLSKTYYSFLTEEEIVHIKNLENTILTYELFSIGESVKIMSGALKDSIGTVIADRKSFIMINLFIFGREVALKIGKALVVKNAE